MVLGTCAGPTPATATFSIEFDDEAATLVIDAFEQGSLDERAREAILATDGYQLLIDQVAAETRPRSEREAVIDALSRAFESAALGEPNPGFELQRARSSPAQYRAALLEYRRHAGRLQWRVSDRLRPLLPPSGHVATTVHLIVGGRGAGFTFSDRDAVVIRLDDFVVRGGGEAIDLDRVAAVLAHELFHVGFRAAGGLPPRPGETASGWTELASQYGPDVVGEVWRASALDDWNPSALESRFSAWVPSRGWAPLGLDRFVTLMSTVQNEGCAVFVDAPLRDLSGSGRHAREIEIWMQTVEADMRYLADVADRFARGATPEEMQRALHEGLRDNGPLYRVGYQMAKRIDEHSGRRPLIDAMTQGPLEFFETYFDTRPYGSDQIDARTQTEIERIIEEIRAVGRFDPRG